MKKPYYGSFYEHLSIIRIRPEAFLDRKSIRILDTYLLGYECFARIHDLKPYPEKPSFSSFDTFVKQKFGCMTSSLNWAYIIYHRCEKDEERSFDVFFELLDEFLANAS